MSRDNATDCSGTIPVIKRSTYYHNIQTLNEVLLSYLAPSRSRGVFERPSSRITCAYNVSIVTVDCRDCFSPCKCFRYISPRLANDGCQFSFHHLPSQLQFLLMAHDDGHRRPRYYCCHCGMAPRLAISSSPATEKTKVAETRTVIRFGQNGLKQLSRRLKSSLIPPS